MSNGKWNGGERRQISLPLNKEEFLNLSAGERDWKILKTFSQQVQTCSGRFTVIEKKVSWARHAILVGAAFLAGLGVLKAETILKFIGF